ncbi:hypothetical protein J5N97_013123 [Dioscorea zingiberensis]|uniref:Response regulatory domain-containing protein n=1 Tax=Dioscorea zingiberensis TaxID=325984 RepID=A0A9D5CR92_9LILI|nr:hypothetical protein J5N97_013123 [Dioscorea zingiberensis]
MLLVYTGYIVLYINIREKKEECSYMFTCMHVSLEFGHGDGVDLIFGVHVTVTTVDSVNKALEFLGLLDGQQQEIDVNLIITDYCMPGMTGYDLLKKIKESHLKDIPVVIMLLRIVLISLSWDKLILNNSYLSMVMKTGLITGIISLTEGVAVGRTFASLKDYKVDGNM